VHLHSKKLAAIPAGRRTKFLIVLAWIAVMVALGPAASRITDAEENDAIAFLPRSAESTQVAELQERFQGEDPPAVVVYARNVGITAADRAAAEQDRTEIAALHHIGSLGPVIASQDGKALLLPVPIQTDGDDEALAPTVDRLRAIVGADPPAGLSAAVTGPAGGLVDMFRSFDGVDTTLLLAAVVALLLLLTYRSPVLWLLPADRSRCRRPGGEGCRDVAVGRAGDPRLIGDGRDRAALPARCGAQLQPRARAGGRDRRAVRVPGDDHAAARVAGGVRTVGVLAVPPAVRDSGARRSRPVGVGRVGVVGRRPRLVWARTALVLVGLAFGASGAGMQTGLSSEQSFRTTPESVVGQQLVTDHFPAGASDPAQIVASASAADSVVAAVRSTPGVASVQPVALAGDLVLVPAVLSDAPDTPAAEATIERLRNAVHAVAGGDAIVGGSTAIALDTRNAQDHDRRVVIPLVLLVVLAVLALLLRSLVAPLLLVATVVLSYFAAVGASYLVFDLVFGWTAVDHSLLLLGFVFLVALGVDYNIFLMHRVREEVGRIGHREGVLRGLAVTGGVITSAGLVLAATFAVLGVLPLVTMTQLGVLVGLGVLLDTFIVRSILVPALALDAGRTTWWPGRLAQRRTARLAAAGTAAGEPDLVGAGAD
jgi:RND superfamily putative drug exporter